MWRVRWAVGWYLTRKPPNHLRLACSWICRRFVCVSDFRGIGCSMTALAPNLPNRLDRSAGSDGKADPQVPSTTRAYEGVGRIRDNRPDSRCFFPGVRDWSIAAVGHCGSWGRVNRLPQYVPQRPEFLACESRPAMARHQNPDCRLTKRSRSDIGMAVDRMVSCG